MNVIYLGYRKWAFQLLKKLLRKKSRQWQIKALATTLNPEDGFKKLPVPVVKVDPVDKKALAGIIKKYKADILLAYGWSWIIPKEIWSKNPTLIMHTSPLPKYRGGSPLQHQIMSGEKKSAVTIFKADGGLDTGDIYGQASFSLEGKLDQILKRIANTGASLTFKILNGIAKDTLLPVPQDHSKATSFKRRKPQESELMLKDFKTKTAKELYDFIRALADPYPNAYIVCKDGKKLFLTSAHAEI